MAQYLHAWDRGIFLESLFDLRRHSQNFRIASFLAICVWALELQGESQHQNMVLGKSSDQFNWFLELLALFYAYRHLTRSLEAQRKNLPIRRSLLWFYPENQESLIVKKLREWGMMRSQSSSTRFAKLGTQKIILHWGLREKSWSMKLSLRTS